MQIIKTASAGTMESSDIMITVTKGETPGVTVRLTSSVEKQFGSQIKAVIADCAKQLGVEDACIIAIDQGALDCVIKARTKTALYRAAECTDYRWEA
ncbi:citrate lyase acyl carrier protein [Sphaerochaeta sp.]|uniref:citrate lyase acyl carrier protein n=1 Tax=Sphaerochaeta sp. TaxID=1972642 RepID=UPI00258C0BE6|nr:citrate lyase acyl carrier protein [Sphaerochaeta sp.]MDD3424306.1 citrate lyase acyl carrier protein [Sphaerochaeta sp.]MDD3456216.1 citrate lyase acyl carrier protein [Sphaerochaeta sp.]